MTDPRFQRLIDIVGEAMLRPAADRESFLASVCEGDETLLRDSRELIAQEAIPAPERITARLESLLGEAAAETVEESEGQPSRIGPYQVLGTLGRGGMGSVYLARQEKPLERDVAIKVVRGSVVDRQMLARFASETQALARMAHPNIARVFDAGRTEDGLPYFVMEYVDGIPVTDFCAEHRLDLSARLTLFHDVCRAVHHAHQRGVIHRDLKPSNILVMERDGRPFPKVIDFGIAKAAEGLLSGESVHTRVGSLVGTVDYMSPEQLRGDATGVDVRTDVYSLGIVLYQLVSGRHPFADTTLRRAGLLEARRIALESDPPRPSRSSVGTGDIDGEGGRRGGETGPALRPGRDLDWVVMKAIEKDRERRYASALDLLRDLERYERDEPVSAGPPSLAYRGRKFVRRHRVGVTAAAAVFFALFSGAVAASVGFVRASNEAQRAQAISTFLTDMLASVRPDEDGRSVTVQEVLDEARARLEAGEFSDRPETEASLALVIGHSYEGLGRYDEAIEMIRHSAELRRRLHGPEDERLHASLYRLGTVLWKRGDLDEALALREELETMSATLFGPESAEHAESLSNLGNTHADRGELADARRYLEEAVAVGRTLAGESGRLDLARFLNNLGTVFVDLEEYDPARAAFQETLDIRRPILGEHNDVYAITLGNLGSAQMGLGDLEAAEATFRRAVELDEDIYGPDHPRTAPAYSGLASVLSRQGRLEEAEPLVRNALRIRSATSGPDGWRAANERRKLGELLLAMGRMEEARGELQRAWDGLVAVGEETTATGREVAEVMHDLETRTGNATVAAVWRQRTGSAGPVTEGPDAR